MAKLFNRAKMTTSSTGTGTITLGSAENGFQSFADAGVVNNDVVQYLIEEGTAWEIGEGTYTASGTTLTRTPSESSIGGGAITLGGTAKVSITATHSDFTRIQHDGTTKAEATSGGITVTGNITIDGNVDGRDVSADGAKLDGIAAGADVSNDATITISAGNGLSTGGSFTTNAGTNKTITIDHSDTSSQASVNNSGNTVIQDVTLDTYGHVTGLASTTIVGVPSGVITLWSGSTASIPSGWVICDGTNNTPDLRDRFVVGAGSSYAVDATGGSSSVTLSTAQMPSHTHTGPSHTHSVPSHTHTGPSHTHSVPSHTHTGPSHSHTFSGTTSTASLTGTVIGVDNNSTNYRLRWGTANGVFSASGAYSQAINSSPLGNGYYLSQLNFNASHAHTYSGTTSASGTGNTGAWSGTTGSAGTGATGAWSGTTGSSGTGATGSAGSGNSHENRPPYYALAYIMKT
jgi:microcystin-dependent protein